MFKKDTYSHWSFADHSHNHTESLGAMEAFKDKNPRPASLASPRDSAAKLRTLLEKRQSASNTFQNGNKTASESDSQDTLSMEDLANLLNDSYNLTKHLEEQVQYYQDTVNMLRKRSEQVIVENETLYERLKENLVSNVLVEERSNNPSLKNVSRTPTQDELTELGKESDKLQDRQSYQHGEAKITSLASEKQDVGFKFHDRKYLYQLEQELDKIKKLNQEKTHRLESILQSTRQELEHYRCQASKLQSQLRKYETEGDQRPDNICIKCGKKDGIFSIQQTEAQKKTFEKLTRERDDLMETLVKHKSLLTDSQEHQFEAYIQVKKSVETVEQAQLEKAEAIIKIQQLRNSVEEERKRQENLIVSTHEKTKQEVAEIKENYEKKLSKLKTTLQEQIQKCDTMENQLDKLSREKVNLIAELEKSKAELAGNRLDVAKVREDTKEEVVKVTRQCVKAEQELDNIQNIQARQQREHEQQRASLVTENEELRRRLAEAQEGWVESREECIRTLEKFKTLENYLHLATASKTKLENAKKEEIKFFKKQEEEREKQFLETLAEKEKEHVALRRELEEMLEKQMEISKMVKEESKKSAQKLEEMTQKHRSDKKEWRENNSQLTERVQALLQQHEAISRKNQIDSKVNKKLSSKVDFLKEENKRAMKTIYELLRKQKRLMQDRQTLSHEVEYLRSHVAISSRIYEREMSQDERESQDDTLSSAKPINEEINAADESL